MASDGPSWYGPALAAQAQIGFISSLVYQNQATRAGFRAITDRGSGGCSVTVGYDLATGIGSPRAKELAAAFP